MRGNFGLPKPSDITVFKDEKTDTYFYEQILLKNCLMSEEVFYNFKDSGLNGSDFYINIHKKLWEAMEKATLKEGISELTVAEYCDADEDVVKSTIEDLKGINDKKADLLLSFKKVKEESLKRTLKGMARFTLDNIGEKEGSQVLQQVANKILSVDACSDIVQMDSNKFINSFMKHLDDRKKDNFTVGVNSGIQTLDKITGGFRYGVYSLVVGRPGHGKTSFLLSCFYNNIMNGEKPVFLSLEMTEEQVGIKLMSIATGIPTAKLENPKMLSQEEEDIIKETAEKLRKHKYSIVDFTSGVNVLEFGIILNKYVNLGYNVAYVDYIQLIKMANNRDPQTAGEFRSVYKNIREICKRVNAKGNMAVIFAAQAGREGEKRPLDDRIPDMRDLEWSASLEQDAALIVGLMNRSKYDDDEVYKNKLMIKIAKNRFRKEKPFMLSLDGHTQYIRDLNGEEVENFQQTIKRWQREVMEDEEKRKAGI
ncbi:MAG: replicative helicase [Clostridiales bacterium]|jgi:replicative DNA helicase|nr:replicative helicase [Clostridiales bacterium]MDK2934007.1 replicative helicase [Clostridiales bacterium]